MNFAQKIGRVLSNGLFKLAAFVFVLSLAFNSAVGSPEPIKDSLEQSGVYETLVPSLVESLEKPDNEAEESAFNNPEVQKIIDESFSPELLNNSADKLLDGFYGWLNGETSEPEFTIDLTGARQKFANGVADYAEERLLSLRPCTVTENLQLANEEVDPLTVKCRPPIVVSEQKQKIIDELTGKNSEFLSDPVITSEQLKGEDANKFEEELKEVPSGFQILKTLPYISGAVALISALALFLLHDKKRQAIKQIAVALLSLGLLLLASTLLFEFIFNRINNGQSAGIEDEALKNALVELVRQLSDKFNRTIMLVSLVYALAGAGTLGALWYTKRKNMGSPVEQTTEHSPDKPHDSTENQDSFTKDDSKPSDGEKVQK